MTTATPASEYVVLYDISWDEYERILAALGEYHLRHTYDRGTLEMRSVLDGVSWEAYEEFLEALSDHYLRHTYDRGTLEMMSPSKEHDWPKKVIARMIESMALELNIPIQSIGSTTVRRAEAKRGLQPDESYYVAHEPQVRGKDSYDPGIDPPPDLAVEVEATRSLLSRLGVYAALGVPEIWRYDGTSLRFYQRNEAGEYIEIDRSLAFPFLPPADIQRLLDQRATIGETALVRSFIEWVRTQAKNQTDS